MAVCRGDNGTIIQKRYVDAWDQLEGQEPSPIVRVPGFAKPVRSAPNGGAKAGTCGGCGKESGGIAKKAVSLAAATAKWIASGFETVQSDVKGDRLAICEGCPLRAKSLLGDQCTSCGCLLSAKAALPHEQCPESRWLQWTGVSKRIEDEPKRHMLYHLYPVKGVGEWQWNVAQLRQRIDLFNGVRSVGIVTDGKTDSVADVQAAFAGHRIDNWVIKRNDARKREGITFPALLETLPKDEGVTFYAHGKGVRYGENTVTRRWTQMLYTVSLDGWDSVREGLQSFPVVGAFKRYGHFQHLKKNHHWHFSGTFFWFRNGDVFRQPKYDRLHDYFACVEAWPANLFEQHEGGCLFGDNSGDLYKEPEIEKWESRLQQWLAARSLNGHRLTSGSFV